MFHSGRSTAVRVTPKLSSSREAVAICGTSEAMSPANAGVFAHEVALPMSIHARAVPAPSFIARLSSSRMLVLMGRSMRPTMPQSIRVAGWPGATKMLPGCGSAWKMRSTK